MSNVKNLRFEPLESKIELTPMTIKNIKGEFVINYFRDKDIYTFKKAIDKTDVISIDIIGGLIFVSFYDGKEFYPLFIVTKENFVNYELKM